MGFSEMSQFKTSQALANTKEYCCFLKEKLPSFSIAMLVVLFVGGKAPRVHDFSMDAQGFNLRDDPTNRTFYNNPMLSYSLYRPIKNWDEKRREWLKHHSSFAPGAKDRIFMVTGSQPSICKNPIGDHLLLRLFKNKCLPTPKDGLLLGQITLNPGHNAGPPSGRVDVVGRLGCRFHRHEFKLPLEKYKNYNLVVDGWSSMIYESRSWVGLNAGVILIRTCKWPMALMKEWANMGLISPNYEEWAHILSSTLKLKATQVSDDQSALIYLLLTRKHKWGTEKGMRRLRWRHAEKVSESYGALREQYLKQEGYGKDTGRRPFITHFTGCQPCSGDHNPMYGGNSCWRGMERALNFADYQVLRNYGFVHPDLLDSAFVLPLPFDSVGL
ncbi:unnamed protein product [Ilex paraguariensis]|uniref:Uncharacterized protein n=1 Tax=Ilex paraguariensis TaxID=185542 RepID=A0ABC8UT52_9AQUA